tara:strand:- start:334 stop:687 length:354 start_codon:yes stop_codon:yes gene_type:complete
MIKLLNYLTQLLDKHQLYELAMFLGDNKDIIDTETMLKIIHEVNGFENRSEYKDIEEHFKKMDDAANKAIDRILENDIDGIINIESAMNYNDFIDQKRKGEEAILKKLLKDNNISLN